MRKLMLVSVLTVGLAGAAYAQAPLPEPAATPATAIASATPVGEAAVPESIAVLTVAWTDTIVGRCARDPNGDGNAAVPEAARACAIAKVERRIQARLGTNAPVQWIPERGAFVVTTGQRIAVPGVLNVREAEAEVQAVAVLAKESAQPIVDVVRPPKAVPPSPRDSVGAAPARATTANDSVMTAERAADVKYAAARLEEAERLAAQNAAVAARIAVLQTTKGASAEPAAPLRPASPSPALGAASERSPEPSRPSWLPTPFRPAPAKSAPLVLIGTPQVRLIPGRRGPAPYEFSVADSGRLVVRSDVRATCKGGGKVRAETVSVTNGVVRCAVWLREDAERPEVMQVVVAAGKRKTQFRVVVVPIAAASYAVAAETKDCRGLATRVQRLLEDRGVAVVSFGRATRRAVLSSCQDFNRLLPARDWGVTPSGLMVLGEMQEPKADPFGEAGARLGHFSLTTTKPGADPLQDAAEQIVARMLKHLSL